MVERIIAYYAIAIKLAFGARQKPAGSSTARRASIVITLQIWAQMELCEVSVCSVSCVPREPLPKHRRLKCMLPGNGKADLYGSYCDGFRMPAVY
ncbi:MAG: hypothetical protein E5W91_25480 [Mesorhizobium sp.]|uniref:hypothetical protein n=1 Tax=Mesorhizobium sp. TaxID=1871066 RepID=UPI0012205142|nr:hypothetical protein [Mesorhizobium sp.]TIS54673.1 MAG: hypothetical protein E5W91_25480 [Mesorhizobium sp.]